jgi:hypothetical protein
MSCASVFTAPYTGREYIFCTVYRAWGSEQRCKISPIPEGPGHRQVRRAARRMNSAFWQEDPVIVGTASSDGAFFAMIESRGKIRLAQSKAHPNGGLTCEKVPLSKKQGPWRRLCKQQEASPTSLRFLQEGQSFHILAIDKRGKILIRRYDYVEGEELTTV